MPGRPRRRAYRHDKIAIDEARLRSLTCCALLHDIVKIGVRNELLSKPSGLTQAEYEEIKEHSPIGAALLSRIPLLTEIAPLLRAVHERWDGNGYRDGLAGSEIPLEARIVAVCDVWHAMISDRRTGGSSAALPPRRSWTGALARSSTPQSSLRSSLAITAERGRAVEAGCRPLF